MDATTEHQDLLRQIEQHADPEHQQGMSMTVPTQLKMYGVKVPHLRKIAADWQRAHRRISRDELLTLVEALWDGKSREERLLAVYLLELYKRYIPDLTWAHFDCWRRGVDNWEVGDALAQWVMAVWMLADPDDRLEHLWALIADDDVWSRRLALVATTGLNRTRKDTRFPDLTLTLVDRVKTERHPMITKAISWALRALGEKEPRRVAAYLEENRGALASHVVREVENKLRTGLKSGKINDRRPMTDNQESGGE
jgi:3-methyladenine DNA glycosylase AlkD